MTVLFHIISAEEFTNFLVNFEDSEYLLANPDLKIHMNGKMNKQICYLESGFIYKYQEVHNIYKNMYHILSFFSASVFLRSALFTRQGMFLLHNKIDG